MFPTQKVLGVNHLLRCLKVFAPIFAILKPYSLNLAHAAYHHMFCAGLLCWISAWTQILFAATRSEMVLDIQVLPETIFSKISSKKVRFFEEKPRFDHLIGMFSDEKISIDDFLEEKQQETELEI